MNRWTELGVALIPNNGGELKLSQRAEEFSIRLSGIRGELMNSRVHGSEEALAELGCARLADVEDARVLVGGLGMGFTLATALNAVLPSARVTVAELIPEVVAWNRGPLGKHSGRPLDDPRTRVYTGDVAKLIRKTVAGFDVIALDVDNGPEGLTQRANDWLYSLNGITAAQRALKPGGILAYWSACPDADFHDLLKCCGFIVEEISVHAHGAKGARHTIWLATMD